MKRNWVKFSEHVLHNDWNPDAVGEKTCPQPGSSPFGSVPVIRCRATDQGWVCVRMERDGEWKECRRTARSLSPRKPDRCCNFRETRERTAHRDCPLEDLRPPNSCEAHILNHMRCTCEACIDLANRWRAAVKDKMRAVAGGKKPVKPKPRRWTCKINNQNQPCPKLHTSTACEAESSDSETECKRYPYVGSPKVNWWFGNYVPSSGSSDDLDCCDRDSDGDDAVRNEENPNLISYVEKYIDCGQKRKSKRDQMQYVREESFERTAREDSMRPLRVSDLASPGESQLSPKPKVRTGSSQTECIRETREENVGRTSRGCFWVNNAKNRKQNHGKFGTKNSRESPYRRKAPTRRRRSKSVDAAAKCGEFQRNLTEEDVPEETITDHFRSVLCTDPGSKTLRTRGFSDSASAGTAKACKAKERCSRNKPELLLENEQTDRRHSSRASRNQGKRKEKTVLCDCDNSSATAEIDKDNMMSGEENGDRSCNNKDREEKEKSRSSNSSKPSTVRRESERNTSFISENLRRNIEDILHRDVRPADSYRYEEVGRGRSAARDVIHEATSARGGLGSRKSSSSPMRASPSRGAVARTLSTETLSDTTRLLRKYGVGEPFSSKASVILGQGQFVQKDDFGFYHVNTEVETDQTGKDQSPARKSGSYKSSFLKVLDWENKRGSNERDVLRKYQSEEQERSENQSHTSQQPDDLRNLRSPIYKTIKIVEGNSFWDKKWNKLILKGSGKSAESTRKGRPRKHNKTFEISTGKKIDEFLNEPTKGVILSHPDNDEGMSRSGGTFGYSKRKVRALADSKSKKPFDAETPNSFMRKKQERWAEECGSKGSNDHRQEQGSNDHRQEQREYVHVPEEEKSSRMTGDGNSDSDDHGRPSRLIVSFHSPPPSSTDSPRQGRAGRRETPESDVPMPLDKDCILWRPWDGDKLSDILKNQESFRHNSADRGDDGQHFFMAHSRCSDEHCFSDNDDDEDFKTASIGSWGHEYEVSSPRIKTVKEKKRIPRTQSNRKQSTCKFDNLLLDDDEYVLAPSASAVSADASVEYEKILRSKVYDSKFKQSKKPLDETRNCQSVFRKRLGRKSRRSSVEFPRNLRSRSKKYLLKSLNSPNRGYRYDPQFIMAPYYMSYSGLDDQPYNQSELKKQSPDLTLNNDYRTGKVPKRKGPSKQKYQFVKFPASGDGNFVNQKAINGRKQTKNSESQTAEYNSYRFSPVDNIPSEKNGRGSVDWVKRREAEQRSHGGNDNAHTSSQERCMAGILDDSDPEGGDYGYHDPIETINIRGRRGVDKARRPLVEVNIYGPLDEEAKKLMIRESRGSQINSAELKKVVTKLGEDETPESGDESPAGQDSNGGSETPTNDTDPVDASHSVQDESTNHSLIARVKESKIQQNVASFHVLNKSKSKAALSDSEYFEDARYENSPSPRHDTHIGDRTGDLSRDQHIRPNANKGLSSNNSKKITHTIRNIHSPILTHTAKGIPALRISHAHQNKKIINPSSKRTGPKNAHHSAEGRRGNELHKCLQEFENNEWQLPARDFDESRSNYSTIYLESNKHSEHVENVGSKNIDSFRSQKANVKGTPSSSNKKVSSKGYDDCEDKKAASISVPTGPI
ncbi:hypothetical protein EGW08_001120 [Elysia chlorotica]|uniref:Uncharacterized protein n=1 Tax=Elysia chlorotica TaxID=188477 RepID=A0A3S1I2Q9_ELYCH|nr:hypothetical protein EGW08_001120 [Elysia chlorotica]